MANLPWNVNSSFGIGMALAEGDFEGVSDVYVFGTRLLPTGGTEYDVAPLTGAEGSVTFLDAPQDLYIVSTSASDTGPILLITLDDELNEVIGTYTLNGTTPVNIGSWLGVQPVGFPVTTTELIGDVYVSTSNAATPPSGTILGKMLADDQQMSGCYYTVPKGFYGHLFQATPTDSRDIGAASSQYGTLHLFTRDRGIQVVPRPGPWRRRGSLTIGTNNSSTQLNFMPPIQFDEGTDVILRAEGNNNNHRIAAYFGLVFKKK